MDMFRLNALLSDLLEEGDTFDPATARELFEVVPASKSEGLRIEIHSKTSGRTFTGLTGQGNADFEDDEETHWESGPRQGLWIGKWIVNKVDKRLFIEPRFGNPDSGIGDYYVLSFDGDSVCFKKIIFRTVEINIPVFGWYKWYPRIKGWLVFNIGRGRPRLWKRPVERKEISDNRNDEKNI